MGIGRFEMACKPFRRCCSSLWLLPALAQPADRPVLLSPREVAVVDYFRWVEARCPFLAVIFNRPAGRVTVVIPEQRTFSSRADGGECQSAFLKPDMSFVLRSEGHRNSTGTHNVRNGRYDYQ